MQEQLHLECLSAQVDQSMQLELGHDLAMLRQRQVAIL
jgi:hypothetical protein